MRTHGLWDKFPTVQSKLQEVLNVIGEVIDSSPSPVKDDLKNLYCNSGKLLRPAFLLLSATAGEEVHPHLIEAAASIELLHGATLIHDDVIDRSPLRRGRPTAYAARGAKQAVLTGDYLLSRALELASRAHAEPLVKGLSESISRLCLSEIRQDSTQGEFFIDREEYFRRIQGKTAELFGLSCFTGAVLSGVNEEVSREFYRLGIDFGMAFQIEDDILDYGGNGKLMGKRTGSDIRAGIPTLPLILALEEGGAFLQKLCRYPWYILFPRTIGRIVLSGKGVAEAGKIGKEYRQSFLERLDRLDFPDKKVFRQLVETLVNRKS
ncbi:MAG: polyprenyl synthetase family protein [Spirochaetales bacterium]|nr:polyprenyl synthetase family protein [Spirochaetales bacterium]